MLSWLLCLLLLFPYFDSIFDFFAICLRLRSALTILVLLLIALMSIKFKILLILVIPVSTICRFIQHACIVPGGWIIYSGQARLFKHLCFRVLVIHYCISDFTLVRMRWHRCKRQLFVRCLRQFQLEDVLWEFNSFQEFHVTFNISSWYFIFEVLLYAFSDDGHFKDLLCVGSWSRIHLDQRFNNWPHLHWVMTGYLRIRPFEYFFVESVHVISPERRHQGTHFVEYAP